MKGFQDGWSTASRGVRGKRPAWRGRPGQFRHSPGHPIEELGLTLTELSLRSFRLVKWSMLSIKKDSQVQGRIFLPRMRKTGVYLYSKGGKEKNREKFPEERTQNYMWRVPLEQWIRPGLGKTMLHDGLLSGVGFICLWKLRGLVLVFRVHK